MPVIKHSQLFQSCEEYPGKLITQGFKANPGLKLANAFSVVESSATSLQPEGSQEVECSWVFFLRVYRGNLTLARSTRRQARGFR